MLFASPAYYMCAAAGGNPLPVRTGDALRLRSSPAAECKSSTTHTSMK